MSAPPIIAPVDNLHLLTKLNLSKKIEKKQYSEKLEELQGRLGLHRRSARDFFDAVVALGFLDRTGDTYRNTPATDLCLDKRKPTYIGGIFEMCNHRLYLF